MKQTVKLFIHESKYSTGELDVFTFDMSDSDYVLLGTIETELEFNMPSHQEITAIKVTALKEKKQTLKNECAIKVENIDNEIQKLMAITSEVS